MIEWKISRRGVYVDTVFFAFGCDADYVRRSLIEHDDLPPDIQVHRVDEPEPDRRKSDDRRRGGY